MGTFIYFLMFVIVFPPQSCLLVHQNTTTYVCLFNIKMILARAHVIYIYYDIITTIHCTVADFLLLLPTVTVPVMVTFRREGAKRFTGTTVVRYDIV
jgi:hypothetical protein